MNSGSVALWFQPRKPSEGQSARIKISGGKVADQVSFDVVVDSDTITLEKQRESFKVGQGLTTRVITFTLTPPQQLGHHHLWVRVYQKERLVQVLTLAFRMTE